MKELKEHGSPASITGLVDACLNLPAHAEPSSQGWRVARRAEATRAGPARAFAASLEAVPNVVAGRMSSVGMTHALRALSCFRAASSRDVAELSRLLRGTANPWVGGVGLTALAASALQGLAALASNEVATSL